jgi:hypothetical protein
VTFKNGRDTQRNQNAESTLKVVLNQLAALALSIGSFIGAVAFLAAAVGIVYAINRLSHILPILVKSVRTSVPYSGLFAGLSALLLGILLYQVREIRKHFLFPPAEMCLGMVMASYSIKNDGLAGALAFIGGVRIVIDGFKRYLEFKAAAKAKRA